MAHDQVHRIEDLSVAFISLVEAPANQRSLLVKSASADQQVFERQVVIAKQDAARRMAYGLVLVPDEVDDWKDTISGEEIEKAAYAFMRSGATTQIDAALDEAPSRVAPVPSVGAVTVPGRGLAGGNVCGAFYKAVRPGDGSERP